MKVIYVFLLPLIFGDKGMVAAQPPCQTLSISDEIKRIRSAANLKRFNASFVPEKEKIEFVERVKAIKDTRHPLRRKCDQLPEGYLVFKRENKDIKFIGIISSMRQLIEMFGPDYSITLSKSDCIIWNHFKKKQLEDGEMVNLGAVLLGSQKNKHMLQLIQQDTKNDYIAMTQQAYKGKADE